MPQPNDNLQQKFAKEKAPQSLDGFYKGSLWQIFPATPVEKIAGFVFSHFYLPWYGKTFNRKTQTGDNLVPAFLQSFVINRYGKKSFVARQENGIRVFPFQTKVTKGLQDDIKVLQLNYDLPENPKSVRNVIDELVEAGQNTYLGKAYLKKNNGYRLIAFFQLEK